MFLKKDKGRCNIKIIFSGIWYYGGPVRHLYTIFEIYKKLAKTFETVGIECFYFSKQNEILPQDKTLDENAFYGMLPECDLLFMWNGSLGKEVEIAEACRQQGTPVYFMELGWLPQMHNFYFDRKGVNFTSSITDWDYSDISEKEKEIVKTKIAYYHQNAKRSHIKEKDFVFVPLQVEGDSQIVKYSPRFKKMQELVNYVGEYIKEPGERIIFKKHPKDDPGELTFPENAKYVTSGSTHDYLINCDYVITINSTVGVEALTYNKPIITLGQAFYGGRGLTHEVTNDEEMKQAVRLARKGVVALGRIEAFLSYLFEKQWHKAELNKPEKVLRLIDGLTDDSM